MNFFCHNYNYVTLLSDTCSKLFSSYHVFSGYGVIISLLAEWLIVLLNKFTIIKLSFEQSIYERVCFDLSIRPLVGQAAWPAERLTKKNFDTRDYLDDD